MTFHLSQNTHPAFISRANFPSVTLAARLDLVLYQCLIC